MRILSITLLLIFFTTSFSFGQKKGFSEGYIITKANESIEGYIKARDRSANSKSIIFLDKNNKRKKYSANSLLGYGRAGKSFQSFQLPESIIKTTRFMEEVIIGEVSLYVLYEEKENLMDDDDNDFNDSVQSQNFYLIKKDDSQLFKVTEIEFRPKLRDYLSDNADLVRLIENKELRYDDLEEIVKIYNRSKE